MTVELRPIPRKFVDRWPEWWMVDPAVAALIRSPGVQALPGGEPIVHRSHLPLLSTAPSSLAGSTALGLDWLARPRQWQLDAIEFVEARRASLVRFDPRMGKTAVAVAAHDPRTGPLVIAGPLAAEPVWREWILRRWPHASHLQAGGRRIDPRVLGSYYEAIFIHYGLLPSWTALGMRIGTLVLDEPHLLYTHKTQRAAALYAMAPRAHKIIALDGTPVWNRPEGLWGLLSLLAPGAWGSFHDYAIRYASAYTGPYGLVCGEPSNVDELQARLASVVIDRSWEGEGLIEREVVQVPLDDAAWAEITAASSAVRSAGGPVIAALTGMRQRLLAAKRAAILAQVARVRETETHVIVWTWYRESAVEIGRALDAVCSWTVVTGDDTAIERQEAIVRWRETGGALVITLGVGQVAIDLSAARTAIVAELDWTPNVHVQADYRSARPDRTSRSIYVIAEHPVEQAVVEAIVKKSEGSRAIGLKLFDDGATVLKRVFGLDDPGDLERLRKAIQEASDGA